MEGRMDIYKLQQKTFQSMVMCYGIVKMRWDHNTTLALERNILLIYTQKNAKGACIIKPTYIRLWDLCYQPMREFFEP